MTRKEALTKAIDILSGFKNMDEVVSLLTDLKDELPLIHWTEKSIRDTIEQFILDNGKTPTASDFRKKGMPPHPVFKLRFNMTLAEWLNKNYPRRKPNYEKIHKQCTEDFIKEYMRIKPSSSDDYNNRRADGLKCWISIANYNNVKNWCDLLRKLSLPSYSGTRTGFNNRTKPNLSVVIHSDFNEINKLYSKLTHTK